MTGVSAVGLKTDASCAHALKLGAVIATAIRKNAVT
jgi:hypothetical protein